MCSPGVTSGCRKRLALLMDRQARLRYAVGLDTDMWNQEENVCGGEVLLLSDGTVPEDPDGTEN